MDPKSSPTEMFVTSIRLPREEHELLKAIAHREHRSLSQQMRYMIRERARADELEAAA